MQQRTHLPGIGNCIGVYEYIQEVQKTMVEVHRSKKHTLIEAFILHLALTQHFLLNIMLITAWPK